MRRALKFILILTLIGIIAGGGGFLYMKAQSNRAGPHDLPVRVLIKPGASLASISRQLFKNGVIANELVFRLWARYTGQHTKLRAGEFDVPAHASVRVVLDVLQRGETVAHKLTFAEGLNVAEMLILLQEAKGLIGPITHIPGDGMLLPETYYYSRGDTRDVLLARMKAAMDTLVQTQWQARLDSFVLKTPNELVTLASIVEKETGIASERPKVAAVFLNRLKKGMRLQSDPTVVYALTHGLGPLGRALTRQDLKINSPFNTYRVKGLPPSPISNPGRESILAVMNPADTDALYFVADGTGGHVFARTLKDHNRNVAKWRKFKRAQK